MGLRMSGLTGCEAGWGCAGSLHAVLPALLSIRGNLSGETLKIVAESAVLMNGATPVRIQYPVKSDILFRIWALLLKKRAESKKWILFLCSVSEASCPSKNIGNT